MHAQGQSWRSYSTAVQGLLGVSHRTSPIVWSGKCVVESKGNENLVSVPTSIATQNNASIFRCVVCM